MMTVLLRSLIRPGIRALWAVGRGRHRTDIAIQSVHFRMRVDESCGCLDKLTFGSIPNTGFAHLGCVDKAVSCMLDLSTALPLRGRGFESGQSPEAQDSRQKGWVVHFWLCSHSQPVSTQIHVLSEIICRRLCLCHTSLPDRRG